MSLALELYCMRYDSWDYKYRAFQAFDEIGSHITPNGHIIRFPFYLQGTRDAHILLTTTDTPNLRKDNVYEICKFNFNF